MSLYACKFQVFIVKTSDVIIDLGDYLEGANLLLVMVPSM